LLCADKGVSESTEDAFALTLAVHTQGKGITGTYTFEVAEQKQ
jgi:ATP-dependent Clp protease adapter protein ClpS